MTVFVLYVATYAVGTLVGIAHGYEAPQAIFESVAMASNGGVSSGLAAGMSPSLGSSTSRRCGQVVWNSSPCWLWWRRLSCRSIRKGGC